jgi:hypothetical protein
MFFIFASVLATRTVLCVCIYIYVYIYRRVHQLLSLFQLGKCRNYIFSFGQDGDDNLEDVQELRQE